MDGQLVMVPDTRASKTALCLMASLHVLLYLPYLSYLAHQYDEGITIALAQLIAHGQTPHQDFFYHQPSTYLYFLSLVAQWAPDSLWIYRLPSLIATTLSGCLLYGIARRWLRPSHALFVPLLFYFSPLQDWGRLAQPYGMMICFASAGLYALLSNDRRKSAFIAGLCMGLSVAIRPLSLPVCVVISVVLLLNPPQRRRAMFYVAGLGLMGLVSWAFLHFMSDGGFSELITFELTRSSGEKGLGYLLTVPGFSEGMAHQGLQTGLERKVSLFSNVLLMSPEGMPMLEGIFYPHVLLLILTVLGAVTLWRSEAHREDVIHWIVLPWLLAVLLAISFLWALPWEDYFIEALAPAALYAATGLAFLWDREGRRLLVRSLIVCGVVLYVFSCVASSKSKAGQQQDIWEWVAKHPQKGPWLTFDPLMHVVTGRERACGIVDPLVGHFTALGIPELQRFSHQQFDTMSLKRCLEASTDSAVLIHHASLNIIDPELAEMMVCDLANPLIFIGEGERRRFVRRLEKRGEKALSCFEHRFGPLSSDSP